MKTKVVNLFELADSSFGSAAALSPGEAVAHAFDFTNADLLLLSDDAILAVARVRRIVCRPNPPPPLMPRPDGRRVHVIH